MNAMTPSGIIRAIVSAACFFVLMGLVDVLGPFSPDINLSLPSAIFFYPSIGFVVEIIFHTLPLTVVWIMATRINSGNGQAPMILICVLIVALVEPIFQLLLTTGTNPFLKVIVVFFIIYGINVQSLLRFTESGFAAMYILRLTYYLLWHMIWKYFRLQILF
jgi:hypothetical protein